MDTRTINSFFDELEKIGMRVHPTFSETDPYHPLNRPEDFTDEQWEDFKQRYPEIEAQRARRGTAFTGGVMGGLLGGSIAAPVVAGLAARRHPLLAIPAAVGGFAGGAALGAGAGAGIGYLAGPAKRERARALQELEQLKDREKISQELPSASVPDNRITGERFKRFLGAAIPGAAGAGIGYGVGHLVGNPLENKLVELGVRKSPSRILRYALPTAAGLGAALSLARMNLREKLFEQVKGDDAKRHIRSEQQPSQLG